jgi:MFS family permease
LWILRFVTALGLGGAVPTGIAQAADYAPVKYRDAMTVAVTTGLAAGATLSGLLGASLIQSFGWRSVFIVGGVLPLLLAPALWKPWRAGPDGCECGAGMPCLACNQPKEGERPRMPADFVAHLDRDKGPVH